VDVVDGIDVRAGADGRLWNVYRAVTGGLHRCSSRRLRAFTETTGDGPEHDVRAHALTKLGKRPRPPAWTRPLDVRRKKIAG